jgi:hypothetical protein
MPVAFGDRVAGSGGVGASEEIVVLADTTLGIIVPASFRTSLSAAARHSLNPGVHPMMRWLGSLVTFVVILAILKFFFGFPISIGGSLGLTIIISGIYALLGRR